MFDKHISSIAAICAIVGLSASAVVYIITSDSKLERRIEDLEVQNRQLHESLVSSVAAKAQSGEALSIATQALKEARKRPKLTPGNVSVDEVAAALVRDYADRLKGSKGERGPKGDVGLEGNSLTGAEPVNVFIPMPGNAFEKSVEIKGVEWSRPSCKRNGKDVICHSYIKNQNGNGFSSYKVQAYSDETLAYTNNFQTLRLTKFHLKHSAEVFNSEISFNLPDKVTVLLYWTLKDVDQGASFFQKIELRTRFDGVRIYKFPDIAIK